MRAAASESKQWIIALKVLKVLKMHRERDRDDTSYHSCGRDQLPVIYSMLDRAQ